MSRIDLPPTRLDAAGLPVPPTMQGLSLMRQLRGSATDWPDDVLVQISESHTGQAVRTRRWKYAIAADETQAPSATR